MLLLNRRSLLKKATALVAMGAISPFAYKYFNKKNAPLSSMAEGFINLHEWHNENFYNFNAVLTKAENEYVYKALSLADDWEYKINDNFSYSLLSHSHRIKNGVINSSRLAAGNFKYKKILKPYLLKILKERNIEPSSISNLDNVIGLGWDFDSNHFKLYFFNGDNNIADTEIQRLRSQVKGKTLPVNLTSYTYHHNKKIENKVYLPLTDIGTDYVKHIPFKDEIKHINLMMTDLRGGIAQLDVTPSKSINLAFSKKGQKIINTYKSKFDWDLDTIVYNDKNDYTLYF